VSPVAAGLLAVTGAANLNGTVSVLAGPGTYATSYTILTAPTITGTFSGLTSSSVFLTPSLIYNPTSVVLQLNRSLVSFSSAGRTPNEIATGAALDTVPTTNPLIAPLAALSLGDAALAFGRLSGEAYASTQGALAAGGRYPRDTALDQVDAAFAAIDALKGGRRNIWGRALGGLGTIGGDGNAAALGDGTGGALFGMDALLPGNSPVTLFGGFSASHFSIPDRGSEVAAQSFHFGVGAGHEIGGFRLKGGFAGSLAGITVDRTARFAGFNETASASYTEATGQLFAELSYKMLADRTTLEPFGRLALVGVSAGSYTETGGSSALSGHSNGYGLALATLGLGASTDFALADDLTVHARGRVGLQQGVGGAPTATNHLAGSDSFAIAGTPVGGTTLLIEADLSAGLTPATTVSVGYAGAIGMSGTSGGVTARLSGAF
jgi:outer membrane autotransporter protein